MTNIRNAAENVIKWHTQTIMQSWKLLEKKRLLKTQEVKS